MVSAPPGAGSFTPSDVARLRPGTLRLVLAPGPAAPPLEDVAAALTGRSRELVAVASALPPARGERLLRLSQRPPAPGVAEAAGDRLVRGLFWPLVYELMPERWEALAAAERLSARLLAMLPVDGRDVLEVAAGAGRLTAEIASRAAVLFAVEPAPTLREHLVTTAGAGRVVGALTQALPFADRSFDVVVSCAAMAPDPPLGGALALSEMERVAREAVALVGPENPGWFVERGFVRTDFDPPEVAATSELTDFFGPIDPPRTLLVRTL